MWAGRGLFSRKMAPYLCTTAAIGCHWILTHWPMIIIVWPITWSTSKRLGRVRLQTNSIRTRSHTGWWIVFGCLKPPQFHLIFPNRTGLPHSFSKYLKILQPCSGSSSFQPFPWQFVLFFWWVRSKIFINSSQPSAGSAEMESAVGICTLTLGSFFMEWRAVAGSNRNLACSGSGDLVGSGMLFWNMLRGIVWDYPL